MLNTRIFYNLKQLPLSLTPALRNDSPIEFHRKLPGYTPSPLYSVPSLAEKFKVRRVWVKDESSRLGLPSFKILGSSWATYQTLKKKAGKPLNEWHNLKELSQQFQFLQPLTLVAATDGNHGRAVAHMAASLGFRACIFVPQDMAEERKKAIAHEGAEVIEVEGSYDDAVLLSAKKGTEGEEYLVISDTAWPGYEEIPAWVVEGYSTIYEEVDLQLKALGENTPDLVAVQMGVGALAASVVQHYFQANDQLPPKSEKPLRIIGVEPNGAACVLESLLHNRLVEVKGPHHSIMAGLNCGLPSLIAWPLLKDGLSMAVSIDDEYAKEGMRLLGANGIQAGESGAAGLGGLLALLESNEGEKAIQYLGLNSESSILILNSEGITDQQNYQLIVGGLSKSGTAEN